MARKRILVPAAKPGQLVAKWGRPDPGERPDVCYVWGGQGASSPDARVLSYALEVAPVHMGKTLRQELETRGYDLTTLRFSIQRKDAADGA